MESFDCIYDSLCEEREIILDELEGGCPFSMSRGFGVISTPSPPVSHSVTKF